MWYGFGNCKSPFVNISCRLQWEKLPDFNAFPVNLHWREDTKLFPVCWILIGQFKFPARQPYVRKQLTSKILKQNSNKHGRTGIELWAKSKKISGISDAISPAFNLKKSTQYVRACDAHDGPICSKNSKTVHIIGKALILEMVRAYGLRPRSWLLIRNHNQG